jgi:hypothetical protein
MRVPREPGEIVLRPIVAKVVEEQEWIEFAGVPEPKCTVQFNAGTLHRWLGEKAVLDSSNRHRSLSSMPTGEANVAASRPFGPRALRGGRLAADGGFAECGFA